MTRPLSPKFAQRLRWMETESRFAHACPDLDQEFPDGYKAQEQREGALMFPVVHSLVGWFLVLATIVGVAVAVKIVIEWSQHG